MKHIKAHLIATGQLMAQSIDCVYMDYRLEPGGYEP